MSFAFWYNTIEVTIQYNRLNLGNLTGGIPPVNLEIPPVKRKGRKVADIESVIINLCKESKGILEIAVYLGYRDKKTVHRYLDHFVKKGRIALTLPEKHNSRNHKYITIK